MLNTDAKILIEKIKDANYNLSEWEIDFMSSIEEQADRGKKLSDKQGAILQKIYRKTQGGGIYVGQAQTKKD